MGILQPELRFPEFEGDLTQKRIDEIAPLQRGFDLPVNNIISGNYPVVFSNGILKKHNQFKVKSPGVVTGRSGTIGKISFVEEDYWPHNTALWVTDFKRNLPKFIYYFYLQFDLTIDEKINLLKEKKSLLEEYKKGMMQKIFNQEIRFKDDNGNDFEDWRNIELGEVLDYIQPTKFIVKSTDYNDNFNIPVLTAGKTFILGYTNETDNIFKDKLPVIIFDDFTTANKFVDFPFKVKSSAMKILICNNKSADIKYIYEFIQTLNFGTGDEHKRYWISEYSKCEIDLPCIEEQIKIANFLSAIDEKIALVATQIEDTQEYKKGLLQQMFV